MKVDGDQARVRGQPFENIVENIVNRQRVSNPIFHRAVDLVAIRVDIDRGFRAHRQRCDLWREIALVRAAYLVGKLAERVYDLGGARD